MPWGHRFGILRQEDGNFKVCQIFWVKYVWVTEKGGSMQRSEVEHLPIPWLMSRGLRGHEVNSTMNIFSDISS